MAEFKVNDGISDVISGIRTAGGEVNSDYSNISSDDVETLTTASAIIKQHADIKALFDDVMVLVEKDVLDLEYAVDEAKKMDSSIANATRC